MSSTPALDAMSEVAQIVGNAADELMRIRHEFLVAISNEAAVEALARVDAAHEWLRGHAADQGIPWSREHTRTALAFIDAAIPGYGPVSS